MKLAILLAGLSCAANAQLVLATCGSTGASTVGASYSFGSVAAGTNDTVYFCVENQGVAAVTIQTVAVSGSGFTLPGVNGTLPYILAPSNQLEFPVSFLVAASPSSLVGTYSASLVITTQPADTINVVLLATLVAGPTLTVEPSCTLTTAGAIDFGTLTNGSSHLCNIFIENLSSQALTLTGIAASGGFQILDAPAYPYTIAASGAPGADFALQITPACESGAISGKLTLTLDGINFTYPIQAQGADPPLNSPTLTLSSTTLASSQQPSISMSLANPAVCNASGNLNLEFTPSGGLPDDASIVFLSGSTRTLPFTVAAGSTSVNIAGQSSATFQTGTTAGNISFTLTGIPIVNAPALSVSIPAAPISIELAAASDQITGQLNVEIVGFDNTYSAGQMSFAFADTNGNPIGAAVTANFASVFSDYFAQQTAGSAFLVRISFPVMGTQADVGTVAVTLTNSAGQAQTGTLTFQ